MSDIASTEGLDIEILVKAHGWTVYRLLKEGCTVGEAYAEANREASVAINRYAATMAREARIEEIQLLIGAHNNDPSTDRYDVITVSRELLNKRMDALASPDGEKK